MIISENREKVKRKALRLINKIDSRLSNPEKKFVLEMVLGMVISGSSNISEIGRALHEPIALKHTTKRLERMLTHAHILEVCNQLCLEESVDKVDEHTIIALDGGDTVHRYGEKFEHLNYVRDSSADKLEKGYWLNQLIGCLAGTSLEGKPIIAKIETPAAVDNIKNILNIEQVFGIMVARGDLGVLAECSRIPQIQQELTKIIGPSNGIPGLRARGIFVFEP